MSFVIFEKRILGSSSVWKSLFLMYSNVESISIDTEITMEDILYDKKKYNIVVYSIVYLHLSKYLVSNMSVRKFQNNLGFNSKI